MSLDDNDQEEARDPVEDEGVTPLVEDLERDQDENDDDDLSALWKFVDEEEPMPPQQQPQQQEQPQEPTFDDDDEEQEPNLGILSHASVPSRTPSPQVVATQAAPAVGHAKPGSS